MAQDDYYYEIQLTNKQLVFYFMAGAAVLILSFLVGVMVGRGVDATSADSHGTKTVSDERIVPEESPVAQKAPQTEDLSYAQRLESERVDDTLTPPPSGKKGSSPSPKGAAKGPSVAPPSPPSGSAPPLGEPSLSPAGKSAAGQAGKLAASPAARMAANRPAPSPVAEAVSPPESEPSASPVAEPSSSPPPTPKPSAHPAPSPKPSSKPKAASPTTGSFAIQVGAFKDKTTADSVVEKLKAKGFGAYVVAPEGADGGLYNVRVGPYPSRGDAEKTETRLRDEEKFKPFIVKN